MHDPRPTPAGRADAPAQSLRPTVHEGLVAVLQSEGHCLGCTGAACVRRAAQAAEGVGKRLTGDRNQCQGCKQYFNSTFAFDKHRTGGHGKDRRCLTPEEMSAKGMGLNAAGFWISAAMPESVVAAAGAGRAELEQIWPGSAIYQRSE